MSWQLSRGEYSIFHGAERPDAYRSAAIPRTLGGKQQVVEGRSRVGLAVLFG
jgi:hypothetical protein